MKNQYKSYLGLLLSLASLAATANDNDGHAGQLGVTFINCTEFAGVASVDVAKAQALVPSRYTLFTDADGAKLVVRVSDCAGISVNGRHPRPGRVAHIGIEVVSPDGTGTDPLTSINNYTLTYASNVPALVSGLGLFGVPAVFDAGLDYEYAPPTGPSQLYASVSPENGNSPTWFLYGTVTNPTYPSPFLANWWYSPMNTWPHSGEVKMATTFPTIYFDFTSTVSFYTSRSNLIGLLIGGNTVANFPVSYRGQYQTAQMTVTTLP